MMIFEEIIPAHDWYFVSRSGSGKGKKIEVHPIVAWGVDFDGGLVGLITKPAKHIFWRRNRLNPVYFENGCYKHFINLEEDEEDALYGLGSDAPKKTKNLASTSKCKKKRSC